MRLALPLALAAFLGPEGPTNVMRPKVSQNKSPWEARSTGLANMWQNRNVARMKWNTTSQSFTRLNSMSNNQGPRYQRTEQRWWPWGWRRYLSRQNTSHNTGSGKPGRSTSKSITSQSTTALKKGKMLLVAEDLLVEAEVFPEWMWGPPVQQTWWKFKGIGC